MRPAPSNHLERFTYNQLDNLMQMQDSIGATLYTYDAVGCSADPGSLNLDHRLSAERFIVARRFIGKERTLINQRATKTDPLTRSSSFIYDNAGRLTSVTDRKSNTVTFSYTPSDKPDTITYPDASTVHFTYDQLDNLTQMQDSTGTTLYTYDNANRLTSRTDPHNLTVSYTYDAAGNLTELTYPGNRKVLYTYDELNRLKTVKINWLPTPPTATYTYDNAGRLTTMAHFNSSQTTYGYNNADSLTSLDNRKSDTSLLANYQFTLDGNGNRTQATQNEPLTATPTAGSTNYTYNTQKNRLLTAGSDSFAYDNEGQLNTGYGSSYIFDYAHRLTGIGSSYQFQYDGSGNRIQAIRSGTTTRYLYDAAGNLLAETDGSNNITRYYIYGKGLLAMVTPTNQVYCYHFNATGSTIAMTDQSQTIVNSYVYDAYGNVTQSETISQPFKYVGQFGVMTEPNGFYYMRARYYDPKVGRFISEDPIGFDGGDVNLYAYVGGNPVMGVDPSGLWDIRVHGPSHTQFVDDNVSTSPLNPFAWKYHFNVNRADAISGMKNAKTATEYLTYKHSWQDSYDDTHNGFMAPLKHLLAWIPYILTLGQIDYLNPDSPTGYNSKGYQQMEKDSAMLPEYRGQQQRVSSCSQ